jgi:beta-N-acetylhexosaminidase
VSHGAAIFGCASLTLSDQERRLFEACDPLGFILFARNLEAPEQVRALVAAMRESVGREAPVLIDQEGGRVARLGPPHWREAPAAARFGELAKLDRFVAAEAAALNSRLLADELAALGIDVDCLPVLDVPAAGADAIIGDRAYGDTPEVVAMLGRAACGGLLAGGVLPVIKHIPGHGRAGADSHLALPVVATPLAELEKTDFAPFRALADMPLAMTAHVVYADIDRARPATLSPTVIGQVIRGAIGFDGLLMSDDIGMGALSGPVAERGEAALAAGCDVVLHCNGEFDEMQAIAKGLPRLDAAGDERLAKALAAKRSPQAFDVAAADSHVAQLLQAPPS